VSVVCSSIGSTVWLSRIPSSVCVASLTVAATTGERLRFPLERRELVAEVGPALDFDQQLGQTDLRKPLLDQLPESARVTSVSLSAIRSPS
jgi:hypothetical protein